MCKFFGFYGFAKSDLYEMAFSMSCLMSWDWGSNPKRDNFMNFTRDLVPVAVAAKGCLARRQIEVFGVVLVRTEPLEPPKTFWTHGKWPIVSSTHSF